MSRATLVDMQPEEETADTLENEEPVETQLQEEVEQPQQNPTVPDKYQNKSLEEVVQMHQEAEKLLGRQSSEVGELRKVVDDFITSQRQHSFNVHLEQHTTNTKKNKTKQNKIKQKKQKK